MQADLATADWRQLEALLPDGWDQAARTFRAIRASKGPLSDPSLLLRLLIGHAASGNSLRDTAAHVRTASLVNVSNVALFKRLANAADWLRWIVEAFLETELRALPVAPLRLRLVDATVVSKPNSDRADYRMHMALSLPEKAFVDAQLTTDGGAEGFERFEVNAGDVFVGDRAYGTARGVAAVVGQRGHVVVRVNATNLPMYRCLGGPRIDVLGEASGLAPGEDKELEVSTRYEGEIVVGRLCIHALTEEQAAEALRRRLKKKGKKNKKPRAVALESTKYVFVFTTLPRGTASCAEVFAVYRLRWQIEIAFKTCKSVLKMGELPSKKDETAQAWLLAKLCAALLLERALRSAPVAFPPSGTEAIFF